MMAILLSQKFYKERGMLCPVCNVELKISERSGVEIDYCPKCRGVWLDRGELDKIIERSNNQRYEYTHQERRERHEQSYDKRQYESRHGYKPKKKESFLSELFDF